jgi:hypothetical protein
MRLLAFALVLASSSIARAGGDDDVFAKSFNVAPDKVHNVKRHDLPRSDFNRVLIGRYDYNNRMMSGAVLVRCDAKGCNAATHINLADGEPSDNVAFVDLNGAPGGFSPNAAGASVGVGSSPKLKWPAMVLSTRTARSGIEHHSRMYLVSLLGAGETVMQGSLEDHYADSGGTTTSYRFERGASKAALDIIVKEQRHLSDRHSHCLEPKPTEIRYKLVERHYQVTGEAALPHSGCG